MKWYAASHVDAERWQYAGESREDAVALVRHEPDYRCIAHERSDQAEDSMFWSAVANVICSRLEMADEELAEEGWSDCEDGWISFAQCKLEKAMAEWLPAAGLARPAWRTIEDAETLMPVKG